MTRPDIWRLVHLERAALIVDLEQLSPEQWQTASLCEGWTIHDVAAHLSDSARTSRVSFAVDLVRARFDFDAQNQRGIARERGANPTFTLGRLREAAKLTKTPPAPLASRLVEEIVHGEDIRRPLGITRSYPPDAVVLALEYQLRTSASMGGARELLTTVRLVTTDGSFAVGEGPEVRGPVLELLLTTAGRAGAEIDGPGVSLL